MSAVSAFECVVPCCSWSLCAESAGSGQRYKISQLRLLFHTLPVLSLVTPLSLNTISQRNLQRTTVAVPSTTRQRGLRGQRTKRKQTTNNKRQRIHLLQHNPIDSTRAAQQAKPCLVLLCPLLVTGVLPAADPRTPHPYSLHPTQLSLLTLLMNPPMVFLINVRPYGI